MAREASAGSKAFPMAGVSERGGEGWIRGFGGFRGRRGRRWIPLLGENAGTSRVLSERSSFPTRPTPAGYSPSVGEVSGGGAGKVLQNAIVTPLPSSFSGISSSSSSSHASHAVVPLRATPPRPVSVMSVDSFESASLSGQPTTCGAVGTCENEHSQRDVIQLPFCLASSEKRDHGGCWF